jgi:hypothetical protein
MLCQAGEAEMTGKANEPLVADAAHRRAPVRVRTRRITTKSARLYPPDGAGKIWWGRLKKALGTTSSDFVSASLLQLQAAAQFPGSGVSEIGINAALAQIEGFAPQNEVEAALAVQMACTHAAAMSILAKFENGQGPVQQTVRLASAVARLLRAFTTQFEAYRRLRRGGDQYVRVEHVHISEGGQAVIGNVQSQEGTGEQPGPKLVGADLEQGTR